MASPCIIIPRGELAKRLGVKDGTSVAYERFVAALHDGLLDDFIQNKTIDPTGFKLIKKQPYAVQKQAAGQIPVQPGARAGEKVEKGKPQAEPEEVAPKSKEEEVTAAIDRSPLSDVIKNAMKSLASIGVSVNIVSPEEFRAIAGPRAAGGIFKNRTGEIFLAPDMFNDNLEGGVIVWHESTHPIINIIRNTDKPLYDKLIRGLRDAEKSATGKNKAAFDMLSNWLKKSYEAEGDFVMEDENITEFMARAGAGLFDLEAFPTSLKQAFIDFVNAISSMLGGKKLLDDTDMGALKNMARDITAALQEGKDLTEIVGKEGVGKYGFITSAEQNRVAEVFDGILEKLGISYGTITKKGERKATNGEIASALNKYYKAQFKTLRIDDFGKKALDTVSDHATDEIIFALERFKDKSGKGWYTEDFAKALEILQSLDPDILKDPEIKEIATVVIAIASNSTDVGTNLVRIIYAVDQYKNNKTIPTDVGTGKGMSAIASGVARYNKLLGAFNGDVNALKKFMQEVRPVSESKKALMDKLGLKSWAQVLKSDMGTDPEWNDDEVLPTSVIIFGPKIGAFYSNLSGLGGTPTIDRWCIRTMYRYRGDMRSKVLPSEMNDFIEKNNLVGQSKGNVLSLIESHANIFNAILTGKGEYAGLSKAERNEKLKPYRKGSSIWNKMENVVNEIEDGLTEKISNKSQYAKDFRSFTKKAFESVKEKVKDRTGIDLEISDIQAILWIFEKNLFGYMGVKQKADSTYSAAANTIVGKVNSGEYSIENLRNGKIKVDKNDIIENASMGDMIAVDPVEYTKGVENQNRRINSGVVEEQPSISEDRFIQSSSDTERELSPSVKGNRLFSKPLEDATRIANEYMVSIGKDYTSPEKITSIDKERAKRIAELFDAMKADPNNPEVRAAYKAMAEETLAQFDFIVNNGYVVEINNNEPYESSGEMIEDLRDNQRMKIFSTESGFGDEPITDKQRKENPLLEDSGRKDVNGEKLLVNDVFRFVHDFFGHAELGNGFGPIGEENAWNVHVRMYSPLAARAMTTETRGQNSWVNFSGVNEEAFKVRDQARKLRSQGKIEEAKKLTEQVYGMMKFADQKVGLLPEWVSTPGAQESRGERILVPSKEMQSKMADKVSEIKDIEKKGDGGVTFNLNGTQYDGIGLVVPIATLNTNQSDINPKMIADFVYANEDKIGKDAVKVGLYKFVNSNKISIDLNIIVPEKYKKQALEFARIAGQKALFDLRTGKDIETGATGENPMEFSSEQFKQITSDLPEGRLSEFLTQKAPGAVKLMSDNIGINQKEIPLDGTSKSVELGKIKASNGVMLDISAEEINLSYPGKKKFIRKITAIKDGDVKAILSFWVDNGNLIIRHIEGNEKGAGYGTDLVKTIIEEAKSLGIEKITAEDVESLKSEKYWDKLGFSQDPESRSNRILNLTQRSAAEPRKISPKKVSRRAYEGAETDGLKDAIAEHGLDAEVQNQKESYESAKAFVESNGIDDSIFAADTSLVNASQQAAVYAVVIDKLSEQINAAEDPVERGKLIAKQASIIDRFSNRARGGGQFISMLNYVYKNSDFPYSYDYVIKKAVEVNQGNPLTDDERKLLTSLVTQLNDLTSQLEEAKKKAAEEDEKVSFEAIVEAVKGEKKEPSIKQKAKKLADKIREGKTTKRPNIFQSATPASIAFDAAVELAALTVEAGGSIADAISKGLGSIKKTDWYKGLSNTQKGAADNAFIKYIVDSEEAKEPKKKKETPSVDEDGNISIPTALIENLIKDGVDTIEGVTEAIHAMLVEEFPDITEREVRDAITKYGKRKYPPQDDVKKKISEIKRDGQLLSALEDVESGKAPEKSGFQREKPTDTQREMMRKIKEAMKELPEDAADVERRWASTQDRITTTLENRIRDLQRQIAQGERDIKVKKDVTLNEKNKALKEQVQRLEEVLDSIVGRKEMSHEQKVKNAVRAIDRAAEQLQREIDAGDIGPVGRRAGLEDPRIDAARENLNRLKDIRNKMRDEQGIAEAERIRKYKERMRQKIAEYENMLATGNYSKKAPKKIDQLDSEARKLQADKMLLKNKIDTEIAKIERNNRTKTEKAWDIVADSLNTIRSIMASGDLSAILRQGGILGAKNPLIAGRAFLESLQFAFSQEKLDKYIAAIMSSPDYGIILDSKLFISSPSAELNAKEEDFMANLLTNIPVLKQTLGAYVKGTERAYVGYLNKLRVDVFMQFKNQLEKEGYSGQELMDNLKAFANFINNATGRGSLNIKMPGTDKIMIEGDQAAKTISALAFAPRFVASRFNVLKRMITMGSGMPKAARIETMKTMGVYMGLAGIILAIAKAAGADTDDDPKSSDFGKIKVGDVRYDIWGGLQQVVVLLSRLMSPVYYGIAYGDWRGRHTKSSTKESVPFATGGLNERTANTIVGDFLSSKGSPLLNMALEAGSGKGYKYDKKFWGYTIAEKGEPVEIGPMLLGSLSPIWMQDIREIYQNQGLFDATMAANASFFGLGMGYYQPTVMVNIQNDLYNYMITNKIDWSNKKDIKAYNTYVDEVIMPRYENDPEFDQVKADGAQKTAEMLYDTKNKPYWYRDMFYIVDSDKKLAVFQNFTEKMTAKQKMAIADWLYDNYIISDDFYNDKLLPTIK